MAPFAGIPLVEQHLPSAAWLPSNAGRRRLEKGNGSCWERDAPEPLWLQVATARMLKPDQTAGLPFHAAQNASQRLWASLWVFAAEEWKVSCCQMGAGRTEQDWLQIPWDPITPAVNLNNSEVPLQTGFPLKTSFNATLLDATPRLRGTKCYSQLLVL